MYQNIQIIGHLGRDPEMRYTPSGQAVTNFSVAVSNEYKNKNGEQVKETTWFRVSNFGNAAEACNTYLHKGSLVFVEGRIVTDKATGNPRVYEKQDKTWASSLEINSSLVKFLSSKSGETQVVSDEEELPEYMTGS